MPNPGRFNPEEFLTVANHLANFSSDEAFLRAAVGRAYYAAYLLSYQKVQQLRPGVLTGSALKKKGSHVLVVTTLRKLDRTAGDQLSKIKQHRQSADYHMEPRTSKVSDWNLQWAQTLAITNALIARLGKLK